MQRLLTLTSALVCLLALGLATAAGSARADGAGAAAGDGGVGLPGSGPSGGQPVAGAGSAPAAAPDPPAAPAAPAVPPSPATSPAHHVPTTFPGPAHSSTQRIWQVQVGGCLTGCTGTVQLQSAGQQAVTVQPGTPAEPPAGGSVTSSINQVQVGCQRHCFAGPGPAAPPPDLRTGAGVRAIDQLLSGPAAVDRLLGGPAGLRQLVSGPGGLAQLLATLVPARDPVSGGTPVAPTGGEPVAPAAPEGREPVPGAHDTAVDQASYQAQAGGPGTARQTQVATQVTVQAGTAPSAGAAGGAVSQARQGIWQLQVGCMFDCTRTEQVQQATQSDTLIVGTSGDPGPVAVTNTAEMRISQLQIGCLFWCYATVQVQSASAQAGVSTVPVAGPPARGSGSPSSAGGSAPAGAPVGSAAPAASVAVQTPPAPTADGPLPVGVTDSGPPAIAGLRPPGAGVVAAGSHQAGAGVVAMPTGRQRRLVPASRLMLPTPRVGRPAPRAAGNGRPVGAVVALGGAAILLLAAGLIPVLRGVTGRRI